MANITMDEAAGLAKRVYDSVVHDLRPASSILTKRAGWDKGSRNVGESYQVSVALRNPNGFTYAGSAATAETALKAVRPMVIKQASILPFELDLKESILWAALSRLGDQGEGAVAGLFNEVMSAMKVSASNRLEASILCGQRSLGVVEVVTDLGSNSADLTITAASWRPGLWWAMGEGTTLDAHTGTATLNNTSGPLILTGIKSADRKLTVTYTGTVGNEVAAGDDLWFEGAYTSGTTWLEMPGLLAQAANTTTSSLGIDASVYSNWKGNTKNVGGNFTFDTLEEICGELRDRGAAGRLSAYMPNKTYSGLASELKSLRIIDSSYQPSKNKMGQKAIEFETPDIGEVEIINHPFMAWGEVYVQDDARVGRVGSSDITFGVPGMPGEKLFFVDPTYNKIQLGCFSDQATVNKRPNHAYLATGVTHT